MNLSEGIKRNLERAGLIFEKSYTLYGYDIIKTNSGYRIYKDEIFQARKRTLELAKDWVRSKVKLI